MCHPSESRSEEVEVCSSLEEEDSWSSSSEEEEDKEDIWPSPPPPFAMMEEEGVWPPVWRSVEKSPQYHLIEIYFRFEEDYYFNDYPPGAKEYEVIKRFIQQVRESRGYDVDCNPSGLLNPSPFVPFSMEDVKNSEALSEMAEDHLEFVIRKINARAKRHGEEYAFDKLVKVVVALRNRTFLYTFTVKEVLPNPGAVKTVQATVFHNGNQCFELDDWRFKPQEASTTSLDSSITS